jgi:superfamily II DNA helicase RecQ
MQIKLFTISINSVEDYNEELNRFLRSHKIIEIEKQLIQTPTGVYWCMYISYIMPTLVEQAPKERVDYKQALSPAHFVVFSVLREARKKIATNEGVSAYIVFTDAELAEIAQLPEISISKLKSIKGIGDKKADKYGKLLIDLLNKQHHETDGQSNTENS